MSFPRCIFWMIKNSGTTGKKSSGRDEYFQGQGGACAGMGRWFSRSVVLGIVEAVAAAEIGLEGIRGLAEIVEKAGEVGPLGGMEGGCELGGEIGDIFEV